MDKAHPYISYFDQPCACHNYYNQSICYCFDMNINSSLFNLPKKMLELSLMELPGLEPRTSRL